MAVPVPERMPVRQANDDTAAAPHGDTDKRRVIIQLNVGGTIFTTCVMCVLAC